MYIIHMRAKPSRRPGRAPRRALPGVRDLASPSNRFKQIRRITHCGFLFAEGFLDETLGE